MDGNVSQASGGKTQVTAIAKRAVVVAMCINLLAGAQYVWSMLGSSLMTEYGWTATQATLPYSTMMVVTSLWAIVVGQVTDRIGPHVTIRLGAVCIAASLIIAGHTGNWYVMMFAIGILMAIASTSFTSNTTSTAVKFMPLRYKGLATGIVGAGMGWTALYMAPLIRNLLEVTTIANTFTILGIMCGGGIMILSFLLPNPMKHQDELVEAADDPNAVDHSKYKNSISSVKDILKTKETWILFTMFGCAGMAGQMATSQLNNIAVVQIGLESGAAFIMALGLCNGLGRLAVSALSDRLGTANTWRLLYAGTAVAMVLLANASSYAMMMIGVVLMGLFYGGGVALIWPTDTAVFGKKYVTSIQGVVTNGFAVAAMIGPIIAAQMIDRTGSYSAAFYSVIAFAALGFILSFTIKDNYDEK